MEAEIDLLRVLGPAYLNGFTNLSGPINAREGTNCSMGISTLVAGTVVVSNKNITANTRIFLTPQNASGTAGSVSVSARVANTSFTILSTSNVDTRNIAWLLIEPS